MIVQFVKWKIQDKYILWWWRGSEQHIRNINTCCATNEIKFDLLGLRSVWVRILCQWSFIWIFMFIQYDDAQQQIWWLGILKIKRDRERVSWGFYLDETYCVTVTNTKADVVVLITIPWNSPLRMALQNINIIRSSCIILPLSRNIKHLSWRWSSRGQWC